MKKILFITAFTPSKGAAAEKNTMTMLEDLARNYQVDLVFFAYDSDSEYKPESDNIRIIRRLPNSRLIKLRNVICHPFLHPYFTVRYSRNVLKLLSGLIAENEYSAIIFDHSQTFNYAKRLNFSGPKLMISHDVMAQRAERGYGRLFARFCRYSEGKMLNVENAFRFSFCQKDADLIRQYYGLESHVVFIYIDGQIAGAKPEKINDGFVMLANWARPDNANGAVWLLNELDACLKDSITISIVGKNFPVGRVGRLNKIRLDVLGFVDNPYVLLSESKAMLSPLLTGAGIKVKVMESLACGTPVIGTDISFEGFSSKYDSFMIHANTQKEFAECIERLDFPFSERMSFKDMFIKDYQSETIPCWVDRLTK